MITIVTGTPGAGKTYFLTKLGLKYLLKGHDVYFNYFVDYEPYLKNKNVDFNKIGRVFYWDSIEELCQIKGGQVFIDEAQGYFDSREWQNLPPVMKQKFSVHRHEIKRDETGRIFPLDIWAGVQNVSNIDKWIRDRGQEFVEVRNLFGLLFVAQWFDLKELKDETIQRNRKALDRMYWLFSKKLAKCYDTHEAVNWIEYPEFLYYREYEKRLSNKNTGLIPIKKE